MVSMSGFFFYCNLMSLYVFLTVTQKTSSMKLKCIYILPRKSTCRLPIYIYRKSASRFSRGTVLNTLKQSRINIMRGKKDATTFPDKPVS